VTSTLPGGAGEAVTAYALKKFSKFNLMSAFRILILTRIMDLAGYSLLLLFTAILISETTPYRDAALLISGVLFIVSMIISHPRCERIIVKLFKKANSMSETRISKSFFGVTMFQTMFIIICAAFEVHYMLKSFGAEFILIQSLYCFSVYTLFQMVPVQGFAGIGTQAAWWSLALMVAGYKAPDVIAMGIILHGTFYAIITGMSLVALLAWQLIRTSD
jgi:hypothetical protein